MASFICSERIAGLLQHGLRRRRLQFPSDSWGLRTTSQEFHPQFRMILHDLQTSDSVKSVCAPSPDPGNPSVASKPWCTLLLLPRNHPASAATSPKPPPPSACIGATTQAVSSRRWWRGSTSFWRSSWPRMHRRRCMRSDASLLCAMTPRSSSWPWRARLLEGICELNLLLVCFWGWRVASPSRPVRGIGLPLRTPSDAVKPGPENLK